MHISELAAVALVEDDDKIACRNAASGLSFCARKYASFWIVVMMISRVVVFHLPLQNGGAGVAVGRAFFKAVIFLHRLIVQVLAVYDE